MDDIKTTFQINFSVKVTRVIGVDEVGVYGGSNDDGTVGSGRTGDFYFGVVDNRVVVGIFYEESGGLIFGWWGGGLGIVVLGGDEGGNVLSGFLGLMVFAGFDGVVSAGSTKA